MATPRLRHLLRAIFIFAMSKSCAGYINALPPERLVPQGLKPDSKQSSYRSGEPLRHPKSKPIETSFRRHLLHAEIR
jgi:hypothetical protein